MFESSVLNDFMGLSWQAWSEARAKIRLLLTTESANLPADALKPMSSVTMHLPANIGDYTDFYSSLDHATNVGTMFRLVLYALVARCYFFAPWLVIDKMVKFSSTNCKILCKNSQISSKISQISSKKVKFQAKYVKFQAKYVKFQAK